MDSLASTSCAGTASLRVPSEPAPSTVVTSAGSTANVTD